jgi:peptidoglycan/xylan/chitin deacetylase (PgdA/CDA1 family)
MRIVSLLFHDVYVADPGESGFVSQAADRYKLALADFEAQIRGVAAVRQTAPICAPAIPDSARAELVEVRASTSDITLPFALTVDDGGLSYGSVVADRLEARGWRGHCFVTTNWIGERGFLDVAQIRDLDARGHVIGSHSASHPTRFSACTRVQMVEEWRRSRAALEDVLGHEVRTASVPGGYFSTIVARTAAEAGLSVLFTSEPTTTVRAVDGCVVVGRFAVRAGCPADFSANLVSPSARARCAEWASWNAKKLVKPLLGSSYGRVADWVIALRTD